jgi:cytolysin (calcineurin-like family phosphatase)
MELVDDEDTWYQASLVILRRCKRWHQGKELIKEARVKRELKDMICTHHRDELFYVEQVTSGKYVKDVNAKYFYRSATRRWSY